MDMKIWNGQSPVAGSFEHGNEASGFHKTQGIS
jgi:hypothetical protein